jgi:hypothetical protein
MAVVPIETKKKPAGPHAPANLRPETARWFRKVLADWSMEDHHIKLLVIASECWDRATAAREMLDAEGLTYCDRFGAPHARPECKIEHDAKIGFMRALRELDLDVEPPAAPAGRRPPALRSNRRE